MDLELELATCQSLLRSIHESPASKQRCAASFRSVPKSATDAIGLDATATSERLCSFFVAAWAFLRLKDHWWCKYTGSDVPPPSTDILCTLRREMLVADLAHGMAELFRYDNATVNVVKSALSKQLSNCTDWYPPCVGARARMCVVHVYMHACARVRACTCARVRACTCARV
jgi:hypothetical protein